MSTVILFDLSKDCGEIEMINLINILNRGLHFVGLELIMHNAKEPTDIINEKTDYTKKYSDLVGYLTKFNRYDKAMKKSIGGEFEAFGILERELLIQNGLKKDDYIIDVGCGSGRLAKPLSEYLSGKYLGTDVEPKLLEYAEKITMRSDWRFVKTQGQLIPEKDNQADMVCFFSVFTHLLHEHSYIYLQEAKRVLKPTGKIIFSFLEFKIPSHWTVFETNILNNNNLHPLNQFISRDAIEIWASNLALKVEAFYDGDKPHIPIPHKITLDGGKTMELKCNLGQSVCVLKVK